MKIDMKNLRNTAILVIALVAAMLSVSCQKTGTLRFAGNYSFKTGGTLNLVKDGSPDDAMTVAIPSESGQMDITEVDRKEGRMVVTMNVIGGGMLVYYAQVDGDRLVLDPTSRHISFSTAGLDLNPAGLDLNLGEQTPDLGGIRISADVDVTGTGVRYDDIVLFELHYTGKVETEDESYVIKDSKIDCRARLNQ